MWWAAPLRSSAGLDGQWAAARRQSQEEIGQISLEMSREIGPVIRRQRRPIGPSRRRSEVVRSGGAHQEFAGQ